MSRGSVMILAVGLNFVIAGLVVELLNRLAILGKWNNSLTLPVGVVLFSLGLICIFYFKNRQNLS